MTRMAVLVTAALSLVFSQVAFAEQPVKAPEGVFFAKQQKDQYLAKDLLLNAKVIGAEGKIIGDIEDLILNEYNQVVGVVMGVGGFLGVGEKRVAVRYAALRFDNHDGKTTVSLPNVNRDMLKAMPAYVRARPPKSFFERVQERAQELATKTSETTRDAYEKAKEKVGPAYEEAKKKAGEVYEKAKEGAKDVYEKATEGEKKPSNN